MKPQPLPWCEPIALAHALTPNNETMVLLHSSTRTHYSGRYSLLAVGLEETIDFTRFDALDSALRHDTQRFAHCWLGYIGYELRHDCERYTPAALAKNYTLPPARLMRFASIYQFDHEARTLTGWSQTPLSLPTLPPAAPLYLPWVSSLSSNMSKESYLEKAATIIENIKKGELYQANLTRRFTGEWPQAPDSLGLFTHLCTVTPAPYSAYIRTGCISILSSSPELFLKLDAGGRIETRPIKGSAPRGQSQEIDARNRAELETSAKNRAENLMIVDLMRNDLAHSCVPGSVEISGLYDVTTHATIHHMASRITGQLQKNEPRSRLLRHCFPPGSMTGAPKIRAVEQCAALEMAERGVYSGAIGWLGGDGSMELSVVIRTLILWENRFEFQVGGGIVADSTPIEEWQETIDKAMGIANTLGIERQLLESL